MKHTTTVWDDLGVTLQLSTFAEGKKPEHHAMLHVEPCGELFEGQYARLSEAERRLADLLPEARPIVKRYFLSDAANQAPLIPFPTGPCAVSLIQQSPLDGSKVAAWIYLAEGLDVQDEGGVTLCRSNGYEHLWQMGLTAPEGDSYRQTASVLQTYESTLRKHAATIEANCLRTWFYVRDVDTQYGGMVQARRENFLQEGLTPATHYIASTGIQGIPASPSAIIQLGGYALKGTEAGQVRYVRALTHLNPTIEYGVTFERGTVVDFGDRSHCLISGTASIDNKGRVLHTGDVVKQTLRMWENVAALLHEGGFTPDDVAQIVVYLRDVADYATVRSMFASRFPGVPAVFTLAPVCRPEWLIEMECTAIRPLSGNAFRDF